MNEYKTFAGDLEEVMKAASEWVGKSKQEYKFASEKTSINPKCNLCEKTCYPAEMITFNNIPYHKECFRCVFCLKKVSPAVATPVGPMHFACANHLSKVLQKGSSREQLDSSSSEPQPAEESQLSKREQRKLRLQKKRDQREKNIKTDTLQNEPYELAHRRESSSEPSEEKVDLSEGIRWRSDGKKQVYRYPEDMTGPSKRVDPRCQKCGKTVYSAEKFTYEMVPYHKSCVSCLQCKKKLGQSNATPFGDDVFLCNTHYNKVAASVKIRPRSSSVSSAGNAFQKSEDMEQGVQWLRSGKKQAYSFPEDLQKANPRCNLCGKTAYSAETVTYNGIPYHSACFRCLRCGKKISAGDANPFGDVNYLCNDHFQIVLISGAATISKATLFTEERSPQFARDENDLDPRMYIGYEWRVKKGKQTYKYTEDLLDNNAPRCNYCGKKSYPAETLTYEKIPYHGKCFRCLKCNKKLTPGGATPFGEEVFLCDAHFEQFGQGANLPTRGQSASKAADDVGNLEVEPAKRRRRRRKENQE